MLKIQKSTNIPNFPSLRGTIDSIKFPCFLEPKIDGEAEYYSHTNNHLINKYGTVRSDFRITDLLSGVDKDLFCELYVNNGKNGDLYELLKHKHSEPHLKLMILDVVMPGDSVERKEWILENIAPVRDILMINQTRLCINRDEILKHTQDLMNEGYEGVVLKNMDSRFTPNTCSWVKIKNKDRNNYAVSHIDPTLDRIEVLVQTPGVNMIVGLKATGKQKQGIQTGDMVEVEHQGILPSGSLRHPVLIGKVQNQGGI